MFFSNSNITITSLVDQSRCFPPWVIVQFWSCVHTPLHTSHYKLHFWTTFKFQQFFVSCIFVSCPSLPTLIRHMEKRRHFSLNMSAFNISLRAIISIFMFVHYVSPLLPLSLSQIFIWQKPYLPTVGKKMWFLLNSALWNERKHCINEAEELIHLCLYYCEINYAGLFRKLLIVANWMASISA